MSFFIGVNFFFKGFALANKPGLRRYFWLPAGIGLTLTLATLYLFGRSIIAAATPDLPDWLNWLEWIVVPVLFILLALISAWSVSFITIIIASPLFSGLAMAVEQAVHATNPPAGLTGNVSPPEDKSFRSLLAGIFKDLSRELRKLRYHIPRLVGLIILSLIPVVNIIAPLFGGLYGAWIMSVQFSDYAADNNNMSFTNSLAQLKKNLLPSMGFGAMTSLAMAIPLVNFFLLPAAVAGGTLLWHHNQTDKSE
ncbi:MAG: CysZ protein [Candidatus Azotimanducaceae bacterium]|jgi:CysZ protein|tara:strand:- start:1973 stop:2728 length:756 start_codon:yes stop_codon:yes gene_type:complete